MPSYGIIDAINTRQLSQGVNVHCLIYQTNWHRTSPSLFLATISIGAPWNIYTLVPLMKRFRWTLWVRVVITWHTMRTTNLVSNTLTWNARLLHNVAVRLSPKLFTDMCIVIVGCVNTLDWNLNPCTCAFLFTHMYQIYFRIGMIAKRIHCQKGKFSNREYWLTILINIYIISS